MSTVGYCLCSNRCISSSELVNSEDGSAPTSCVVQSTTHEKNASLIMSIQELWSREGGLSSVDTTFDVAE